MSSIQTIHGRPVSRLHLRRNGNWVSTIVRTLLAWGHAYRTRRQLTELTEAELEDLGLTREAAYQEAIRPFWDTQFDARRSR